jgi:hypothetical protein
MISPHFSIRRAREMAPRTDDSADPDPSILAAAFEILDQGEELLGTLSDAAYTAKLAAAYDASIGGHYRHCLDHFRSLVEARGGAVVNYDHRRRDPLIETDRFAALNETRRLREALINTDASELSRLVEVICKTSYASGGSQRATASFGRELMYAVAHAVHHFALIGIIANLLDVRLPPGFGVAPSTIQHQQTQATAAA